MFGHNDDQPVAENTAPAVPGTASVNVDDQVTSAPAMIDTAGEYIPTAIPGQPAAVDTPAAPAPASAPPVVTPAAVAPAVAVSDDDLFDIKQQALQQLQPLLGHLDQTPEEKFRTTMMLIQASDNDMLIKQAYDAAQQIPDEKVRAQALLDIVNEINYFTQQHNNTEA